MDKNYSYFLHYVKFRVFNIDAASLIKDILMPSIPKELVTVTILIFALKE